MTNPADTGRASGTSPQQSARSLPHISVCVCTYKRQHLLPRLFEALSVQHTRGLFSYSVVVADNDAQESARQAVAECGARFGVLVTYCVEPRQNISRARNKALEHTKGEYIAFIDDDEFPIEEWLVTLFEACQQHHVDGVLGPVKPFFAAPPPHWIL